MSIRKPFDPSEGSQKINSGGTIITKQSFKKECDINSIMNKYRKTGLVDHVTRFQGDYSDLTDVPTYHDAMNKVIEANEAFSTLPSELRKHFSNDPAEFLQFVADPSNRDAMAELGLLEVKTPPPSPPSVASAAAPPTSSPTGSNPVVQDKGDVTPA